MTTIAFDVAILLLDRRMESTGGPGIISLEFAGSSGRATQILAEWGAKGWQAAHLSLLLDYGFMLFYGAFFLLAGLATRDLAVARGHLSIARAGRVIPFFAPAAALFDALENVMWLLVLGGNGGRWAPLVGTVCASAKFFLIALAIGYSLCGAAMWVRGHLRAVPRAERGS